MRESTRRNWERHPHVHTLGASIAEYHQASRNMHVDLTPHRGAGASPELMAAYEASRTRTDDNLALLGTSFTDGWVLEYIEPRPKALDPSARVQIPAEAPVYGDLYE